MKPLILFYSLAGTTRKYATALALSRGAQVLELKEARHRNAFTAFVPGVFQARAGNPVPIEPLDIDWEAHDPIVLAAPIWAGRPAPAINAAIDLLPAGKHVEIKLVSGGGQSESDAVAERVRARGCELTDVENIRADEIP